STYIISYLNFFLFLSSRAPLHLHSFPTRRSSDLTRILVTAFFLLTTTTVNAQEPIRFVRSPDISPDGKTIAFSYLGDIWLVDAKDRKSTRLNSSHSQISYAVFCLKKKKKKNS